MNKAKFSSINKIATFAKIILVNYFIFQILTNNSGQIRSI